MCQSLFQAQYEGKYSPCFQDQLSPVGELEISNSLNYSLLHDIEKVYTK